MSEAADDVLRLVRVDLVPDPRMIEQYRAIALTNKGVAQTWTGNTTDAEHSLHSALIAAELAGLELVELNSLSYLGLVHAVDGRLRSADALVRQAIAVRRRPRLAVGDADRRRISRGRHRAPRAVGDRRGAQAARE